MFTKKDTPSYVVKVYPQASDLFQKFEINFCCKGDLSIDSQCKEKNLETPKVVQELNKKYAEWKREEERKSIFSSMGLTQLTEEIFLKQRKLSDELSSLKQYVERVSLVHGQEQAHLKVLEEEYMNLSDLINSHFEEELIFISLMKDPATKADLDLAKVKDKLRESKEAIEKLALELSQLTDDFTPPINACGTYRVTYSRLGQVLKDIRGHIDIDENLFIQSRLN